MKKAHFVLVVIAGAASLLVSCGKRETAVPPSPLPPGPAPKQMAAPSARSTGTPSAAIRRDVTTPDRCAGDGGYAAAVQCVREARGFSFVVTEGAVDGRQLRATGIMSRPLPGTERVRMTLNDARNSTDDGEWIAVTKPSGIVWHHRNGLQWAYAAYAPQFVERVFQWTTIFLDPQKKEGEAKPDGEEAINGEACSRFRFTNQNNGDACEAWVGKRDGRIVRFRVTPKNGSSSMTLATNAMGKASNIEEPK